MEAAGWVIDWYKDRDDSWGSYKDGRFLGALASNAHKIVGSKAEASEAIEEWELLTGESVADQGCNCCGQPHYFTLYDDDDNYVSSFDVRPKYVEYERDWS
jgi:hypothetical protein